MTGGRLKRLKKYLKNETFLMTYEMGFKFKFKKINK